MWNWLIFTDSLLFGRYLSGQFTSVFFPASPRRKCRIIFKGRSHITSYQSIRCRSSVAAVCPPLPTCTTYRVTQPKSHSGPVIMFSRLTYSRLYHGAFILPIAITVNGLVFLFPTPPLNLTFTSPLHLTCIGTIDNVVSAETVQVPSSSSSFSSDDVGYVSPSSQYL